MPLIINDGSSLTGWSVDTNGIGTKSIENNAIKFVRVVNKSRAFTSTVRLTIASGEPYANYGLRFLSVEYIWDNPVNEAKVAFLDSSGTIISGASATLPSNCPPNVWQTAVIPLHCASLSDIRYFDFYNNGDNITSHSDGETITLRLRNVKLLDNPRRTNPPVIAIQFDDGYQDTVTNALPLFKKYGHVASVGVVPDFFGSTYLTLQMMTTSELAQLAAAGWEICSHTKGHVNMSSANADTITTQMRDSKTTLEALGYTVNHLIYPFTQYSTLSYAASKLHYQSASVGTPPRVNSMIGNNIYTVDKHLLNRVDFKLSTTLNGWKTIVDGAIASGGLTIVYGHDVNSFGGANSVTTAQLESFLQYLNIKGVGTMTTTKALQEYGII